MKTRKIAVISLGRFGFKLAQVLSEKGVEVLALDSRPEKIEKIKNIAAEAIQIEMGDPEVLEATGVKKVDLVVVGIGGPGIENNILTVAALKQLGVKKIIARSSGPIHTKILKSLGINQIISPGKDTAVRLAQSIIFPGIKSYLEMKGPWNIAEIEIGRKSKFKNKTLKEIQARSKYHVNTLMIKKEILKSVGHEVKEVVEAKEFPREDYKIKENDILVVAGEAKDLEEFQKACTK